MDEEVRKAAAMALVEKAEGLLSERSDAIRQRAEIERRIRAIDRALFDCRAGGRIFGVDIELPADARPGLIIRPPATRAPKDSDQRSLFIGPVKAVGLPPSAPQPSEPKPPTVASTLLQAEAEPSVRDLILHYLRIAGAAGEKAAVLRRRVETFLNRQIHYKTIGMSLYRLSKETPPMVRREGQTWFLAQPSAAAKGPGAVTSGPQEGR